MTYQAPERRAGLRLHLNENTAGCSPRVLEALRALAPGEIANYPDYGAITRRVEQYFAVAPGWVQLVNGLDEGLHVVAAVAARKMSSEAISREIASELIFRRGSVYPEPAFEMYRVCSDVAGLAVTPIPPQPDFAFPLDELLKTAPDAGVVYLTDPNNPTGLGIPTGAIEQIAGAAPETTVLVDEAYADFSGRTIIGPALDRHHNLIVGRTFAKGHGLAALRIGALVAHPDALAPLRALLPPFSLNIAAIVALNAALDDEAWVRAYVAQSAESRERIYAFCDKHGFTYWRSEANFVLLRIGDSASAIVATMAERGIFIRDRSSAPGCAGCIRISAGTVDATDRCLQTLEAVLASRND
jgi:histidinol-phosphate aminotransferase